MPEARYFLGSTVVWGGSSGLFGRVSLRAAYVLLLGAFLGLAWVKFGNPVVLDGNLDAPQSLAEFAEWPWPLRWGFVGFLPVAIAGFALTRPASLWREHRGVPARGWLVVLPLLWLGWQFLSGQRSMDAALTALVLPHFTATVAACFLGYFLLRDPAIQQWLWPGLMVALVYCLIRATNQYAVEFPRSLAEYRESDRMGWTNAMPKDLAELRRMNLVIETNGVPQTNPIILRKLEKRRVFGTLVYPNALAAGLLLLMPAALVLAWSRTETLRPPLRKMVFGLLLLLGTTSFFLTGSKAGWLVALLVAGVAVLCRVPDVRLRWWTVAGVIGLGMGIFFVRHAGYFQQGATSASARLDYWQAAWRTAASHPWWGTGPGTFQRPYAAMKSPEQEMARMVHNDYLEQASDSGWPAAVLYTVWVGLLLWTLGRVYAKPGRDADPLSLAIWLGLLGWFLQSFAEFTLYIPALAWLAFLFAGKLLGQAETRVLSGAVPSGARSVQ